MIPLSEARSFVLGRCQPLRPVSIPIDDAAGLVTTNSIAATGPIPPFDNTAMDGFAVRSANVASPPVVLDVVDTLPAGARPSTEVGQGQAIRIMTGAPMPPGADAVVMVEWTTPSSDGQTVTVNESVPVGNHIRPRGDDLEVGQEVFTAGTALSPAHLGVATSIGTYEISVHERPRVGVFSTGDELIDSPADLELGQIRDSNRHTLLALVNQLGCIGVDYGVVPDNEEQIRNTIARAAKESHAVVTSGGVSMGDFDFVKKVLDEIADMRWMQVAIKPAKPLAFGTIGSVPVFGLPGNPVSSMVSFELFAKPGLRKMMGHREPVIPPVLGIAGEPLLRRPDGKTHFARVHVSYGPTGRLVARFAGGQGSHQLSAMASANALAIVPDGEGISEGDDVELIVL